jgi:membrane-associated phospholipid phosphatase
MEGTRSGRPVLAASARPRAAVLLAGCAVLVAVLGVVFAHQSTPDRFDHAVDAPIVTWFAARQGLALWLAYPGTMIPAIVLSLVIALACLGTRRLRGAVLAVAAVPVAVELCEVLIKPWVHRTYLNQVVYPSGHVATIAALAATVTVLLFAPPRPAMPRWLRILILAVAYLAAVAVVVGVIGVRFHYFTDTVAGAAVGIGTVCGLALVLDLIPAAWPSRIPRRSAAARSPGTAGQPARSRGPDRAAPG